MHDPQKTSQPFTIGISPTLRIRGVIATRTIKKGEIIEKSPIILVPKKQWPALKQTVLWKYYYEWNKDNHCIALGIGSLVNHSYTPNAQYEHDFRNKVLRFEARKTIKAGEEIMVNYNYYPHSKEPLEPELVDFNIHQPDKV